MLRRLLQLGALQRVQPHAANAYANFSSLSAATASAWAPPSAAQRPAAALAASALLGVAGRRAAFPAAAAGAASQLTSLLRFASNKTRSAGLKAYKPNTPGFRGRVITSREGLWKGRPHRDLTVGLRKKGGRNRGGSITVRHRGGGAKRLYRIIDFKRTARPAPGTVERVEYDPNRSARIALLRFEQPGGMDKPEYKYVLAPRGVAQGDVLHSGAGSPIKAGNTLPLSAIPIGMEIHNVELYPGRGGQLARAAGTAAVLMGKGGADGYATVKLPSGEQRMVPALCTATIGSLSNPQHKNRKLGKAGASRWLGKRPTVRGVAMNPVDHPHGGGRGKSKGRISQSPWGVPAKGGRTRHNPRTDRFIKVSRHEAKRKAG